MTRPGRGAIAALLTACLAALTTAAFVVACGGDDTNPNLQQVDSGTVISNVTIVNTRDGSSQANMSVVLDAGKIKTIDAAANIAAGGTAVVVDGTGKFLVPGYSDMHTHAMGVVDQTPTYWPQMIANGITSFREMGGSAAVVVRGRKLNQDSAAGLVLAPELLAIPSSIIATPSATTATAMVKQAKLDGADFIKTTSQSLASFAAIMAEAKNQGLLVSGHLYATTSATDASNAGWRAIEHIGPALSIPMDCSADEAALRTDYRAFPPVSILTVSPFLTRVPEVPFLQRALATYDENKCITLAKLFVKNQTWQSLTMIRVHTMEHSADPIYRNDPNLQYVEPARVAQWQGLADQYLTTVPAAADATFRNFWDLQVRIVQLFRKQGVPMLAGSDLGGIWCIPGFSLQQEFALMKSIGFAPLEVLQTTTLRPAEFLNRTDSMGTVDVGKNADLVLLDDDPIADSANLAKIAAVFVKGRYQSKAALTQMLADTAAAYKKMSPTDVRADPNDVE